MLWMTWDVGLRASGQIFGALVVLIGIVLLYGLIFYALIGWFIHGSYAPLLVCADTGANFAVQRVSLDLSQRHDPNMGHISISAYHFVNRCNVGLGGSARKTIIGFADSGD